MLSVLRRPAQRLLAEQHYDAASFALRRLRARRMEDNPATKLDRELFGDLGPRVRGGPFAGLCYDRRVIRHTTAVASKLLGAYESELQPVFERILASDLTGFVDIGCAEGYYAVGLARKRPDVEVIAFDIDPAAREMCRITAKANGVRVDVRGEATTEFLSKLQPGTVVLSDCEGAEATLLDPSRASALRDVALVVEVHEFIRPRLIETLCARFAPSHAVEMVRTASRDPDLFPELDLLSREGGLLALWEGRPNEMVWLVLNPRKQLGRTTVRTTV